MKKLPFTTNKEVFYTLVDDKHYEIFKQYKWHAKTYKDHSTTRVYVGLTLEEKGRKHFIKLHQCIMGRPLGNNTIDHINGDTLNNCTSNLRIVTAQQNTFNTRPYKNKKYKGVCFRSDRKKWRARIRIDGKLVNIGTYKTEDEAALRYNEYAKKLFGGYARLNKVPSETAYSGIIP